MPPKKSTKKPKLDAEDEKEVAESKQLTKKAGTRSSSRGAKANDSEKIQVSKEKTTEKSVKVVTNKRGLKKVTQEVEEQEEVIQTSKKSKKDNGKTSALSKSKEDKPKASKKTAEAKHMDIEEDKKNDGNDVQSDDNQDSKTAAPVLQRKVTEGFETGDGRIPKGEIKISSWNVNGLRGGVKKRRTAELPEIARYRYHLF